MSSGFTTFWQKSCQTEVPAYLTSLNGFLFSIQGQGQSSLGYYPQSNSLMESLNQELESTLRCIAKHNPAPWSTCPPWVEHAQNSLTSSAAGLSPFKVSVGYQPPLFPVDVPEFAVASVQHHLHRCCHVWIQNPRYIRPYEVETIIGPSAVKLKLTSSTCIHPTFHPVQASVLCFSTFSLLLHLWAEPSSVHLLISPGGSETISKAVFKPSVNISSPPVHQLSSR